MVSRIALVVVALVLVGGVAACGGDDESADDTLTEETTTVETTTDETTADETADETPTDETGEGGAAGREVFVGNCGSCHVLADAGTSGSIGPSLDDASLTVDEVEEQVRNGGGGMPAFEGDLSDEEIQSVSEYVADAGQG